MAEFQLRVITTALELLVAKDGPVLLADFPEEDPTAVEIPVGRPLLISPHQM